MSKFGFNRIIAEMDSVKRVAARQLIASAVKYFLASFKKQGYNGQPWREVQRRIPGFPAYEYPKTKGLSRRTKPINVMTGRLRRAVSALGANSRISYSKYDFKVTMQISDSAVPYAKYIQKGTDNMVARPYMGNTAELRRIQKELFTKAFSKAFTRAAKS